MQQSSQFLPAGLETASTLRLFSFRLVLAACVLVVSATARGQYQFERIISGVPVEREGERMAFPFLGGLDRFLPQFVDIDGDADWDLFLLKPFLSAQDKRLEGRLLWFENLGGAPFPELAVPLNFYYDFDVHNWFYFLDIDADGDLDLLHDNGAKGIAFRRNIGSAQRADFALVTEAMAGRNGEPVLNEVSSLPAFCDIDADGDFDFFTGLVIGTIALYRNAGSAAEPVFEFETSRWEDLSILSGGAAARFQPPAFDSPLLRHGANGIEFHDLDSDGDFDFFYGDFFHNGVYYLQNIGSPQEAEIAITDTLWPRPHPVLTRGFNVPRLADWDEDGDPDFFAACLNQDRDNFFFYANEGSATLPQFRPVTNHFLTMIDAGGYSAPAFADLDGDGDQDLVVGNLEGNLVLYENTGTPFRAEFHWVTDAFQGIRVRGFAAHPAFVDIDADGDEDLFVGSFDGTLAFFENRGTVQTPDYILQNPAFGNIDVGLAAAPSFADLDHDHDYDLAVGSEQGSITFFENTGSSNAAHFTPKRFIEPGPEVSDSSPFLFDLDADGVADLLAGQRNGRILHYQGTGALGGMDFVLVSNEFAGLRAGAASTPALVNLDGFHVMLGEEAGGLSLYRAYPRGTVHEPYRPPYRFGLQVYPNPMQKVLHIVLHHEHASRVFPRVQIFSLSGTRVAELEVKESRRGVWTAQRDFSKSSLATGIYFVLAHWGNIRLTQKILLVR